MATQALFRSGTSGLVLPVPNKQFFPPEFRSKSRLSYYASLFNTIEINSSFYKIPQPATFEKWSADTPSDFRFTVKLWRTITHQKNFVFLTSDIDRFMLAANCVGYRKGCLLIQLPPSVKNDKFRQLDRILRRIRQSDPRKDWQLAVEFRHSSWYRAETYKMLEHQQATMVLHDMPGSAIGEIPETFPWVYIRFHGPAGDYRGSYPSQFLQVYARKIKSWLQDSKDVYAYFNNTIGDAIANLLTLQMLVNGKETEPAGSMPAIKPENR